MSNNYAAEKNKYKFRWMSIEAESKQSFREIDMRFHQRSIKNNDDYIKRTRSMNMFLYWFGSAFLVLALIAFFGSIVPLGIILSAVATVFFVLLMPGIKDITKTRRETIEHENKYKLLKKESEEYAASPLAQGAASK